MTRSFFNRATLLAASAGALLAAACGGKVVSGPGGQDQLQSVDVSAVNATVVACGEGFAHPNVCCETAEGQVAACGVYVDSPFHACDPTRTTFPDPRSCCPLSGSAADCVAPPSSPPNPVPPICVLPCPLGAYQPSGSPAGTCCQAYGDAIACSAPAVEACPIAECACPACVEGQPCPLCDCPPQPACPPPSPPPSCGACPAGWETPSGEPFLCCQEEADGAIACFSQGVPPPNPTPGPAPVPVGHGTAAGGSSSGSSGGSVPGAVK